MQFGKISIVYAKNDEFQPIKNFNSLEEFTAWYKQQDISLFSILPDSKTYRLRLICSYETKEFIKNNFEFSEDLPSFWNTLIIKVKADIPNFQEIENINKAIKEKIQFLKNSKIPSFSLTKEIYIDKCFNGILDYVIKMDKIQKQIQNHKNNKNLILILLENWTIKFYEVCHNPPDGKNLFLCKCNDFFTKYFLPLKDLKEDLKRLGNYVWNNKKSWVYLARSKLGGTHPVDFSKIKEYLYKENLLCEIYTNFGNEGLNKVLKFINDENEILKNLCSLYFFVRSNLIHGKNSRYKPHDFDECISFLFTSYF